VAKSIEAEFKNDEEKTSKEAGTKREGEWARSEVQRTHDDMSTVLNEVPDENSTKGHRPAHAGNASKETMIKRIVPWWDCERRLLSVPANPYAICVEVGRSTATEHLMGLIAKRAYDSVNLHEIVGLHHWEGITHRIDPLTVFLPLPADGGIERLETLGWTEHHGQQERPVDSC
jgi:hypothetical protein